MLLPRSTRGGQFPGLLNVARQFVLERIGTVEFHLRAQESREFDAHVVTIQVQPFVVTAYASTTRSLRPVSSLKVGFVPMEIAAGHR